MMPKNLLWHTHPQMFPTPLLYSYDALWSLLMATSVSSLLCTLNTEEVYVSLAMSTCVF